MSEKSIPQSSGRVLRPWLHRLSLWLLLSFFSSSLLCCGVLDKFSGTCDSDSQCASGEVCSDGVCQPSSCSTDDECKWGRICRNEICASRTSMSAREYIKVIEKSLCGWSFRCCSTSERSSSYSTQQQCEQDYKPFSQDKTIREKILNNPNFPGEKAYQLVYNHLIFCSLEKIDLNTLLFQFLEKKEEGASCEGSYDCQSQNCVNKVCVAQGVSPGDVCSLNNEGGRGGMKPCGNSMFCEQGKCANKRSAGSSCSDGQNQQCLSGKCDFYATGSLCGNPASFCDGKD